MVALTNLGEEGREAANRRRRSGSLACVIVQEPSPLDPVGSQGERAPRWVSTVGTMEPEGRGAVPTVVFVTYNSAAHVGEAIDSVRNGARNGCRVLVIDNGSTDDTRCVAEAGAEVIDAGGNLGYSGAINLARGLVAPGSPLLVANSDLVFRDGAIDRLAAAMSEPGVGIVAPCLQDEKGRVATHLRTGTSVLGSLGDALFGARWAGRPRWFSDTYLRPADYTEDHDVAWAGGAALMISPECDAAVGAWDDERFFLYAEETDYQHRARVAGFRVRYVAGAQAMHVGGGSGQPAALVALLAVNRIRCYRSYHGPIPSASFRAVVALQHLLRARDPRHLAAFRTVVDERSWENLPTGDGRVRTGEASRPVATLCLHGVGSPGRAIEDGEERFWITPERLHETLDVVAASPRPVELTIDDGNASDHSEILPALIERGLHATFFIVTDRIGQPGSLTSSQIRELHEAGMGVGIHGATHSPWRDLSDAELDRELSAAGKALADVVGARIRLAACPRGSYDRRVVAALRRHGYERMYTVDGGASRPSAWARTRYTMTRFDTADDIAEWIRRPHGSLVTRMTRAGRGAVKRWR